MEVRCTSTTRTFSITWSLPAMVSMFSTCSGLDTNWAAICWTLSASVGVATRPVRIRELFTASTVTREEGITRAMVWATAEASWSTRMLRLRIGLPMPSKNTASVWPGARPRMEMRRGVCSSTSATAGLVTVTSRASTGSSTIADLPLPRARLRVAEPPVRSTLSTPPEAVAEGGAA